ncbi:MAG TPA: hypothetical protein PK256_26645, partial [Verrucomicrobiota bacterium]|nr:hypothetical protein [Verrucomicrobiota bacterium]
MDSQPHTVFQWAIAGYKTPPEDLQGLKTDLPDVLKGFYSGNAMTARVSVLMPVFNAAATLERAVIS